MDCYWIRNTEKTIVRLRKASHGVAVIPLTSIESHGPHLPLGSDPLCAEYILAKVVARETVAVLPPLHYSYVADARMLPGAVHIRSDILTELVENVCDEVARNGFSKVVLLHCHGGNATLGKAFLRRMLEREKPYAVYSVPVLPGLGERLADLFKSEIGHACEFETSLNLAACPDCVDLKALGRKTFPSKPAPAVGQASTPVPWVAAHPEMAVGEPQLADAERGEEVACLWADAIVKHLRLIKKDRICLRTMKSYARRSHEVGSLGDGPKG